MACPLVQDITLRRRRQWKIGRDGDSTTFSSVETEVGLISLGPVNLTFSIREWAADDLCIELLTVCANAGRSSCELIKLFIDVKEPESLIHLAVSLKGGTPLASILIV